MIFAVILGGASVFFCGFVESIYLFMVCIFLAGLCLNGFETIVYVYITEISGILLKNYLINYFLLKEKDSETYQQSFWQQFGH